ncbi:MAG TPA: VWA domain-containing protein [Candidatus Solibacter sp.]
MTRHAFLLAFTALLTAQTIRVGVDLVSVPVLVLSREGRVVPDLQPADFHLFDNDVPQPFVLDTSVSPLSVAIVVQANQDVRAYLPFIAKIGNALDALLIGEAGEAAAVVYGDDVTVAKPFESGDLSLALRKLASDGRNARAIDAGIRGIDLLRARAPNHRRVLLYIGQPADHGSESPIDDLRAAAETHNVTIHAVTLPEIGKSFVSDTFSLKGLSSRSDRGGFKAGTDLGHLIPTLARTAAAAQSADPFSVLAAATGGTQLHFREQKQLEDAVAILGVELHSDYVLSFTPKGTGYHTLRVEVDVPGAKTHARPGYRLTTN